MEIVAYREKKQPLVRAKKTTFLIEIFTSKHISTHRNILRLCKIECEPKPEYLTNLTCSIKVLSRFRTAINADTITTKPIDNVIINMQIFKKNSVRYLPFMVNFTVNICRFLDGTDRSSFYARFMVGWVSKYSNMGHPCPYEGHVYARNLEPFADKIPVFVPSGDYRLDLHFYDSSLKNLWLSVRGYGTISLKPFVKE